MTQKAHSCANSYCFNRHTHTCRWDIGFDLPQEFKMKEKSWQKIMKLAYFTLSISFQWIWQSFWIVNTSNEALKFWKAIVDRLSPGIVNGRNSLVMQCVSRSLANFELWIFMNCSGLRRLLRCIRNLLPIERRFLSTFSYSMLWAITDRC